MNPKLSVIVLIHNVELYIERCLISLFEQTLKDIEYIFVDDFSTDSSILILEQIVEKYPDRKDSVKFIRNETSRGQAYSRRIGIENAIGEYIIHCDSDDWINVHMYEKLYTYAKMNGLDMVWCDYYRTDGITHKWIPQKCEVDQLSMIDGIFRNKLIASLCNRIVKRDLYSHANFTYPQANMTEDFVIILQLILQSKKSGNIAQPFYFYYFNTTSICMSSEVNRVLKNHSEIIENSELSFTIIDRYGLSPIFQEHIVCKKFLCKEILSPILHLSRYRYLWKMTYKEINESIYKNNLISFKSKIRTFCLLNNIFDLYILLAKIIRYLSKRLYHS